MSNSGIVTQHFDPAVRPQDDLFAHVNGQWLRDYQIPPDRGSDGAFRELRDQAERQVRVIVEAADGKVAGDSPEAHEERLIATLYASFMDSSRIDILGTGPLKDELAAVATVFDPTELARLIGRLERVGVSGPFDSWVDTDPGDPDRYIVNLGQGGLGLPDESYYRDDQSGEIRAKYVDHIAALLRLAKVEADPGRIMALETALARVHWDVVKVRDDTLTYNPSTWDRLVREAPQFPWEAWAEGLGAPAQALDELVVRQPDFFVGLGRLWAETPLEDWRAWLAWQVVHARAPYLTDDFVRANFDFYGRVFSGAQELRQRWKRGISFVEDCVGQAVGRRYVQQHFPPEHKAKMQVLVGHLLEAYRRSIQGLDWLGPETKAKALEKLELFTAKIGYPDRWRDYAQLHVHPLDLVGNVRAVCAWETDRELAKIGQPVDRDEWFMTPQTVNAYYNPGMNEIVFPAAILQPPFFDAAADEASNYGAIGAVIGHEIGHGFDDQGSKHDGRGRLADWWTEADRAAFEARA
ncbi:MAG: peptidase M13, partial [Propionibacteriaceae bacterium]|nr:peptidase M13 [Propionibacteriaceae bacterium]